MVVGFNHNVMYKGEMFHVQTEDSGLNNPHIITLLYKGGTIVSSRKTSYADIIKMENLQQVVEDLMKEQHKGMLRRLKSGEFDNRAFGSAPVTCASAQPPEPAPSPPAESPPSPLKPLQQVAKSGQSLDEIILDYLVAGDDK